MTAGKVSQNILLESQEPRSGYVAVYVAIAFVGGFVGFLFGLLF